MTVGYISGCEINLSHTHSHGTEINIIVSGEFETGLFQENGAWFIMQTVSAGQAIIFPQGAIHFEENLFGIKMKSVYHICFFLISFIRSMFVICSYNEQ